MSVLIFQQVALEPTSPLVGVFYDTQEARQEFFGTAFWENLRDPLNAGRPYKFPTSVILTGVKLILPPDTPVEQLAAWYSARLEIGIPATASLFGPRGTQLSEVELKALSARLVPIKEECRGKATIAINWTEEAPHE